MSENKKRIAELERAVERLTMQVTLLTAMVEGQRNRRPSNPNPVIGPGVWVWPAKPPYQIRNEEKKS